jgi:thermostable 8-oxoguanine DNA glycosylase
VEQKLSSIITIDPKQITNYHRTDNELQAFWLFCILVAGKNSDTTSRVISNIINDLEPWDSLFDGIQRIGYEGLRDILHKNRTGQYDRISRAIWQSINLDLKTCSVEDLVKIHGVGPKTARFFLLHSREFCDEIVLDTHILNWLRTRCNMIDAPQNTPQNPKQYQEWAIICKQFMEQYYPGLTLSKIDLLIWTEMSGRLD